MDMKYDCDLIKDLLPLYHDKIASNSSTKAVEEHLNECNECFGFYQEIKKPDNIPFKTIPKKARDADYLSLAKKLRRTKWYWRFCVGLIMGFVIYLSLMYSDGNRFDAMKAAYASNMIDSHSKLEAIVPMGDERILYIFKEDGIYQNVDVIYRSPYWKYVSTWPNKYVVDSHEKVQLITSKTYGNSNKKSLYVVYAIAVNDKRVTYIELGKKGSMQRQNTNSKVVTFFWDKSKDWDGTDNWNGMIKRGELKGKAYANDGSVLYRLEFVKQPNKQDSYQWIPAE